MTLHPELHLFLRAYLTSAVPPISQRWIAQQIDIAPSALGRYLEHGKYLGREKIASLLDTLGLTLDPIGRPVPDPESVIVLSDCPEVTFLMMKLVSPAVKHDFLYDREGREIGALVLLEPKNSALLFLGNAYRKAFGEPIEVRQSSLSEMTERRFKAGKVLFHEALRLVERHHFPEKRTSGHWTRFDDLRYPELPATARLLAEMDANHVDPAFALDVLRKHLVA